MDSDPQKAAVMYEEIRQAMILVYSARGSLDPAQLADETFDVVINKIDSLIENYVGEKRKYFFGVARNIFKEHQRKRETSLIEEITVDQNPDLDDFDIEASNLSIKCLKKCLKILDKNDEKMILEYYRGNSEREKIYRENLAKKYSISLNSMRVKIYRMKKSLGDCIEKCLNS